MTRREWLTLVGRLGVIGAAAAVGIGSHAHAVTRPTATLNPLFLNVSPRPVISSRTSSRFVENFLAGWNGASNYGYRRYYKSSGNSNWGDFPTDTANITWGYSVDGGDWFTVSTTAGSVERAWAQCGFTAVAGQRYLISFTVDSKTGTAGGYNCTVANATFTGTASLQNITPGRYVLDLTCTVGGGALVRLGIGVLSSNANNASMRFSNVQVEVVSGRAYPYEYVPPGDQVSFPYTYTASVNSNVVGTPTLGATYAVPRTSNILVIGDSWANDPWNFGTAVYGDFPWQMRRVLAGKNIAINAYGNAGARIDQITDQIATEVARRAAVSGACPYTLCIAHGGTNDVAQAKTLAEMQAVRLAQNAAIEAAGMRPVMVTVPPYNAANASMQTVMNGYNAWLKTLGYPLYDLNADANDGADDLKASWNSGDGVHPGTGYVSGAAIMGQRLADLVQLIGD